MENQQRSAAAVTGQLPSAPDRILRLPEVLRVVGLSASTFRDARRNGWAPKPIRLTPGTVGWPESVISAWIEGRKAAAAAELARAPCSAGAAT
jgi:prophage regulatory protein